MSAPKVEPLVKICQSDPGAASLALQGGGKSTDREAVL